MPDSSQILVNLTSTIIFIPINALILWAVIKWMFKLSNKKFLIALKTAAVAAGILFAVQQAIGVISGPLINKALSAGMLLGIGILLFLITTAITVLVNSYAVKAFYKEKTRKAFLVGIAWTVVNLVIGLIIGAIIVGIAIALTLGTGSSTVVA